MMRKLLVSIMILGGFALQILSYFYWGAPLGVATSETYSNPRVPYAALFFIMGMGLVFLSAIVYELLPDKKE